MIEEGQPAPSFALPSDTGEKISLDSLRGRPVVLYFYPRTTRPQPF
jgi:thioredoxin-dependent peroxiredoxin